MSVLHFLRHPATRVSGRDFGIPVKPRLHPTGRIHPRAEIFHPSLGMFQPRVGIFHANIPGLGLKCKMDDRMDGGMILGPGAGRPARSAGQKSRLGREKVAGGAIFLPAGNTFPAAGDFSGSLRPAPGSSLHPSHHPSCISGLDKFNLNSTFRVQTRVGRERRSRVHEHVFTFPVHNFCSDLNTV